MCVSVVTRVRGEVRAGALTSARTATQRRVHSWIPRLVCLPYRGLGMSCLPLRTLLSLTIQTLTHLELQGFLALPDVSLNSPVGCPWAHCAGNSKGCKLKHKIRVPFRAKHCYHMGPLTLADGSPNYDPDGKLKCSDAEECPAQTDFVLGEPTAEFLASMNAYDAAIATTYNNPITNFSIGHYKFPKVAAVAM